MTSKRSSRSSGTSARDRYRYGIGEWYGRSFILLTPDERRAFAQVRNPQEMLCIPQSSPENPVQCTKKGGVCTLRLYKEDGTTRDVSPVDGQRGALRTMCPQRFLQDATIFRWVGETLLGCQEPISVSSVNFLVRDQSNAEVDIDISASSSDENDDGDQEDVGKIDYILVNPNASQLTWCALEIQAVYFSGPAMAREFEAIRNHTGASLPFPLLLRRPDYRSSGPKRLMPQLQIKVPTLRRWGKKMAVVVDRGFYDALGKMDDVKDISNCDIVWFVMRYDERQGEAKLEPDFMQLTTLERAVEGLTAGRPVSLETFENRIRQKLQS